jgi:hypothetical protein
MAQKDRELLNGLAAVGFQVSYGPDGSGLLGIVAERRRGYVNDTGCMALVAERKINLVSGSIERITSNSVIMESGQELPAAHVIMCTGYHDIGQSVHDVFGEKIASRIGTVFEIDEEGELAGNWRPTQHERFWMCGQPIGFARFYSKLLALQILAAERGLVDSKNVW